MALDWSAPDVETARILREEGGPYSPPERRLPIKAVLSVGLCVAAAVLAGAAVTVRSAARAPAGQEHPWAFVQAWKKYLTEECSDRLHALEEEAKDTGRTHPGEEVECKDSEQICTMRFTIGGFSEAHPKCFPAVCQEVNILKGLQEDLPPVDDLNLTCAEPVEPTTSGEADPEPDLPWKKYLTQECHESLDALEEAEDTGRTHPGEEVECKDSEQICTMRVTKGGFSEAYPKCFPVVCQEVNILRGLQEDLPDLVDLTLTCAEPDDP